MYNPAVAGIIHNLVQPPTPEVTMQKSKKKNIKYMYLFLRIAEVTRQKY